MVKPPKHADESKVKMNSRLATLLYLISLVTGLVLWPPGVRAETSSKPDQFIIGVENVDYLPYYSPQKTHGYHGIAFEVLAEFAHDAGYTLQFKPMSVAALCSALESGTIDFKFPYDSEWDCPGLMQKDVVQSVGFIPYSEGVFTRPGRTINGIGGIARLGMLVGFTPIGFEQAIADDKLMLVRYSSPLTLLKAALRDDVDGAYISVEVGTYYLSNELDSREGLKFNTNLPLRRASYHLGTKQFPVIISQFNDWVKQNQKLIRYIASKYGVRNFSQSISPD